MDDVSRVMEAGHPLIRRQGSALDSPFRNGTDIIEVKELEASRQSEVTRLHCGKCG